MYKFLIYLKEKSIIDREIENLLKIDDNYSKVVVSMDKLAGYGLDGVQYI